MAMRPNSLFMRRRRAAVMVEADTRGAQRKGISPAETSPIKSGDHPTCWHFPPEKAQALDRFFADMPPAPLLIRACSATSSCRAK